MDDPVEQSLSLIGDFSLTLALAILFLVFLLLASALVSGSEVALFSLGPKQKKQFEDSKNKTGSAVLNLLENPKDLLAAILIANNFINVSIIIVSAYITESLIRFQETHIPIINFTVQASVWGFLFDVFVITFLILLFGEVIPKVYASRFPEKIASLMSIPILLTKQVFTKTGLIQILVKSTKFIDKRFKKNATGISVDDLSHALEITNTDELPEEDHKILKGIVRFGNTDVREIMCPRIDVMAIDEETPYAELLEKIIEAGYSRIPIYKESFDNVIGVLYLKDLLPFLHEEPKNGWISLVREPFFVPESKKIDDLLNEFRSRKIHMAIVVDEYGGGQGIVTLEDIIEEIVGDISDEFDDEQLVYSKLDENTYTFEGKTSLKDVYRIMDLEDEPFEDVKGESESLAGIILEIEGKIPKKNEKIKVGIYTLTVDAADRKRIKRVKITKEKETNDGNSRDERPNAFLSIILFFLMFTSCTQDYIPKPRAYHRIDLPSVNYQVYQNPCGFNFEISELAVIDKSRISAHDKCNFNLYYPQHKAKIHFSFFDENVKDSLALYTENSHKLAMKHTVKATDILENRIHDDSARVYGMAYRFKGSTASNFQFFVTDSLNYFIHASMYFELNPNPDSLAPVEDYIVNDVFHLIETFRWN